jgi:carbonic anhydrase
MKQLIDGILQFQRTTFPANRALYQDLAGTQSPQWLFITCSDSRVVPSMLLAAGPGELFVCRNAGNIVPAYGDHAGGVSATIEYAIQVLKVRHVIVCGHSDCGAMKAVLHPETVASLPAVANWISYADRARAVVLESMSDADDATRLVAVTEENVLAQLDNLRTHPSVAAKLRAGALELHGWVFNIQHGTFKSWNDGTGAWELLGASVNQPPTDSKQAAEVTHV